MVDTTEFNLVPNNEEEEFTVDFGEVIRLAGSSDFNQLQNRPQYDGQVMTGETDIPKVPTATSELNNDSDYQTGSEVQQTINAAIANKQDKLTAGQNITISEQNVISATGLTEVDWGDIGGNLNDQIDLKDVLDAKQDTLTPGDNVTIANNIISATDTKYTAGNGLSLNGTQFSADTAVLQEKLDAGNAITIENNTINADIYPADFFTNEATDTDTGSNITLDKTIPATLKNVELHGDTEQQAYSGKNLLNPEAYASGQNLYYPTVGTTIPNTFSQYVTSSFSDPTITMTSTAANNGVLFLTVPLSAGTYHISTTVQAVANGTGRISASVLDQDHKVVRNIDYNNIAQGGSRDIDYPVTIGAGEVYVAVTLDCHDTGGGTVTATNPQVELGSSKTAYEPYVGGTASPNPDYPQDIHVVTGEQTVSVTGKNLFNKNGTLTNGYLRNDGTISGTTWRITDYIAIRPSTEYTTSGMTSGVGVNPARCYYDKDKNFISGVAHGSTVDTYFTNTSPANAYYMRDSLQTADLDTIQIEEGSTATDYEPYQSQSYTVDLGSTELCKIGDYQDYIYKSGDGWYVHKETNKHTFTGSENWYLQTSGTPSILYCGSGILSDAINSAVKTQIYSDYFHYTSGAEVGGCYLYNRSVFVFYGDTSTTASTFKTWLGNNNTTVYYPLAAPTDTQITDAGLIADLNALAGAKSYLDVTNFAVTATGTNLPALLKPEVYVKSLNGVLESAEDKQEKLVAGENITIDGNVISAEGSSITPVQTPGSSSTDVMSQNATTSMIFADPTTQRKIKIGTGTFVSEGDDGIEIGKESKAKGVGTVAIGSEATVDSFASDGVAIGASTTTFGDNAIAIGYYAGTNSEKAVALGRGAHANHSFSVALGAGATTSVAGEINVGTGSIYTTKGYNGTNYRLISGIHDGQQAHDAATVGQINATIDAINSALGSSIPHIGA